MGTHRDLSISDEEFPPDVSVLEPEGGDVGGAIAAINCKSITISQSRFENNRADYGGAIYAEESKIIVHSTIFTSNYAISGGGVFFIMDSTISIIGASDFFSNAAEYDGGVLYSLWSNIKITASSFVGNVVRDTNYYLGNGIWSGGGVIYCNEGKISITKSKFYHNAVISGLGIGAGGVLNSFYASYIKIQASQFRNNSVTLYAGESGKGGVLYALDSKIILEENNFDSNVAATTGGVVHSDYSNIEIRKSEFSNNAATSGGVLYSSHCDMIAIVGSVFHNNSAMRIDRVDDVYDFLPPTEGGVLRSTHSSIIIAASRFTINSASLAGGALYFESSKVSLDSAIVCNDNTAVSEGGALFSLNSTITIRMVSAIYASLIRYLPPVGNYNYFNIVTEGVDICMKDEYQTAYHNGVLQIINNNARSGAIYLIDSELYVENSGNLILSNNARSGAIYLTNSELYVENSGNLILSNNAGSLMAFNSNITFMGCVVFVNNEPKQSSSITDTFQEGGAMTLFQSNVFFNGNCSLLYNHAEDGGGLLSIESKIYVYGNLTIAHNTASRNGGGVYLLNSELTCNCLQKSTFLLDNNYAGNKGGGLHAISSAVKVISSSSTQTLLYNIIIIGASLNFTKNEAEMGGGLSLEANAKLYILKYGAGSAKISTAAFIANNAYSHGGAVYVDDETNSGTCASSSKTECFFQVLAVYGDNTHSSPKIRSIYFSQNEANISGSTLYGGLLDRCTVSQLAGVHKKYNKRFKDSFNGVTYFKNISVSKHYNNRGQEIPDTSNISISSGPVKVCLCIENEYNCSHHLQTHVEVKKGEKFNVSLVTVDQIKKTVNATIHASLESTESGLSEGQMTAEIQRICTNLTFNVVSPHNHENLILYAIDGPCKDADLSRRVIKINFLPCSCPIGFQISGKREINCTCDCHSNISRYAEHCDSHTESFVKRSQARAWISYINEALLCKTLGAVA